MKKTDVPVDSWNCIFMIPLTKLATHSLWSCLKTKKELGKENNFVPFSRFFHGECLLLVFLNYFLLYLFVLSFSTIFCPVFSEEIIVERDM